MISRDEYVANRKSKSEDDRNLLISFLKGDDDAFSSIYNKYIDELFAYGMGLGFEREALKDAIQDTFFKFYTNKKKLSKVVHLKYYLFRMLKNCLIDLYNALNHETKKNIASLPFLIEPPILDELIALEDKHAFETEIESLLAILTDRQREAVYLRYIQEMEYEEVAALLNMTAPAVRKLIMRAKKRIRIKTA